MTEKIPECRIGKDQDGCWTVAIADQFGWVTDTGEPLPSEVVATWTPLMPAAESERDRLSLMLRAMARKLVAYRRWTLGDDVPEVHRLRRELAEVRKGRDELTWRRLRMDEVIVEIDNYDGPTSPAELPEDSQGLNILDRLRALMHGDQPAEPRCICPMFADTGGFRIADLRCPIHGVNGTDPGDGPDDRCRHGRSAPCPECPGLTPPDPSGRITDGGPVQPFTDTDREADRG